MLATRKYRRKRASGHPLWNHQLLIFSDHSNFQSCSVVPISLQCSLGSSLGFYPLFVSHSNLPSFFTLYRFYVHRVIEHMTSSKLCQFTRLCPSLTHLSTQVRRAFQSFLLNFNPTLKLSLVALRPCTLV